MNKKKVIIISLISTVVVIIALVFGTYNYIEGKKAEAYKLETIANQKILEKAKSIVDEEVALKDKAEAEAEEAKAKAKAEEEAKALAKQAENIDVSYSGNSGNSGNGNIPQIQPINPYPKVYQTWYGITFVSLPSEPDHPWTGQTHWFSMEYQRDVSMLNYRDQGWIIEPCEKVVDTEQTYIISK